MARRDANLAGLAALGALGYQLSKMSGDKGGAPVEDRSTLADLRDQEDVDTGRAMRAMQSATPLRTGPSDDEVSMAMDAGYMGGGKKLNRETGELYDTTAPAKAAARKKAVPAAKKPFSMTSDTVDENIKQRPKSSAQADYEAAQKYAASPEGRAERKRQEEAQAIENMTGDFLPMGRIGKMLGSAAKSARTALATRAAEETPVTFLGASGRRAVNPDLLPGSSRSVVPYKKGGAVKAKPEKAEKPAAKGWGKARGARGAKYY